MLNKVYQEDLVSIITPAYNASKVIPEAIRSVQNQTYSKWEMLIADDCSPDDTADVVMTEAQLDSRIRLLKCEKNGGPALARNTCLAKANGRWVAFLDSDDTWLPEKLEKSISFALKNNSPLTFTGYKRLSFDGKRVGKFIHAPETLSYKELLGNTAIATSTVLLDRHLTGEINMQKVYYDDFVCWLEILKKGFLAFGLNEDLMRYRVMENSVSRNKLRSSMKVWKTYRTVEQLNIIEAAWHFTKYTYNAIKKYKQF
tara:strand:- start:12541 stop:13311 length:771 start_codon:yes stop_codon:yes gene_type:complete